MRRAAVLLAAVGALVASCSKRAPVPSSTRRTDVPASTHAIAMPREAVASFAVLTAASVAEATRVTARDAGVAYDVRTVRDWIAPPPASLAAMAEGLSPEERASLPKLGTVVVVTARSAPGKDMLAARAGFSAAASVASALHGLVYDETIHRIESASAFAAHAITEPPGASVWRDDRVRVAVSDESDGTARAVTLGLGRFGVPDLEIEGAPEKDGDAIGILLDLVGKELVDGARTAPLAIVTGDDPEIDLAPAPPHEGDPDNLVLRVVPLEGEGGAAYDALVLRVLATHDPAR